MWRNNKFLHNCQDFTILHICHVKKSEIPLHFSDFSPFAMYRNLKFLHMADFSPHVSHVKFVTNMRYGQVLIRSRPLFEKHGWGKGNCLLHSHFHTVQQVYPTLLKPHQSSYDPTVCITLDQISNILYSDKMNLSGCLSSCKLGCCTPAMSCQVHLDVAFPKTPILM